MPKRKRDSGIDKEKKKSSRYAVLDKFVLAPSRKLKRVLIFFFFIGQFFNKNKNKSLNNYTSFVKLSLIRNHFFFNCINNYF